MCSHLYRGLVVEGLPILEFYQITQVPSDSHIELDPRIPVLTGVVKAMATPLSTHKTDMSIRALAQSTGSGRSYSTILIGRTAQLAYSKQFSDVERSLTSSSGMDIVNRLRAAATMVSSFSPLLQLVTITNID